MVLISSILHQYFLYLNDISPLFHNVVEVNSPIEKYTFMSVVSFFQVIK